MKAISDAQETGIGLTLELCVALKGSTDLSLVTLILYLPKQASMKTIPELLSWVKLS
jgi:hypothetical protein